MYMEVQVPREAGGRERRSGATFYPKPFHVFELSLCDVIRAAGTSAFRSAYVGFPLTRSRVSDLQGSPGRL